MDIISTLTKFQNIENFKSEPLKNLTNIFSAENEHFVKLYYESLKNKIFPFVNDSLKIMIHKYRYMENKPDFNDNNKGWNAFANSINRDLEFHFYLNYQSKDFYDKYFCKLPSFKSEQNKNFKKNKYNKSRSFKKHSAVYIKYVNFSKIYLNKIHLEITFGIEFIGLDKKVKTYEFELEFGNIQIDRKSNNIKLINNVEISEDEISNTISTFENNRKLLAEIENKYLDLKEFNF